MTGDEENVNNKQQCSKHLKFTHDDFSLDYQKTLIGISFGGAFASIVALFLTQLLKTNASFHNLRCSKRIIECLLMVNILTGRFVLIDRWKH
jgi:hypothetical protein